MMMRDLIYALNVAVKQQITTRISRNSTVVWAIVSTQLDSAHPTKKVCLNIYNALVITS